jgi:hypothetical protein
LLNDSVLSRVEFHLSFLLFQELLGPNFLVLQVDVVCEQIVEIKSVFGVVLLGKLVLRFSILYLFLLEGRFSEIARFLIILWLTCQRNWAVEPLHLLLDRLVKPLPLFVVIWSWELPENLGHRFP